MWHLAGALRMPRKQAEWVLAAALLATVCAASYFYLCRYVGNRAGVDRNADSSRTWFEQQTAVYGVRFILFLATVNTIFGVVTSWFVYFQPYYLAQELLLGPAEAQSTMGTINLCIIIRPLLGLLSDAVPICGSTRSAYFILASCCSAVCFAALALFRPHVEISVGVAVLLLCLTNIFSYAWCGVILYAIVATEQRRDPVDGAAQLNAVQWGFYCAGSLLGDLSSGVVLEALGTPHQGFWLCCGLWVGMAFCGLIYDEKRPSVPSIDRVISYGAAVPSSGTGGVAGVAGARQIRPAPPLRSDWGPGPDHEELIMGVHGYPWTTMDNHGYPLISMHIH